MLHCFSKYLTVKNLYFVVELFLNFIFCNTFMWMKADHKPHPSRCTWAMVQSSRCDHLRQQVIMNTTAVKLSYLEKIKKSFLGGQDRQGPTRNRKIWSYQVIQKYFLLIYYFLNGRWTSITNVANNFTIFWNNVSNSVV